MISFTNIMRKVLTERMSFGSLFDYTDQGRKDRATDVNVKPLEVTSIGNDQAWTFSYKSSPSTTGQRWQGYILFFKEDVSQKDDALNLDCQVDCTCPDYRYRWAYANNKQDASPIGGNSYNQCINRAPNRTNPEQVPGLCKHLAALKDYLWEKIEPDRPNPADTLPSSTEAPTPEDPKLPVTPATPSISTTSTDTYSDTRSGTLQEGSVRLFDRIDQFVHNAPQFNVPYEE